MPWWVWLSIGTVVGSLLPVVGTIIAIEVDAYKLRREFRRLGTK